MKSEFPRLGVVGETQDQQSPGHRGQGQQHRQGQRDRGHQRQGDARSGEPSQSHRGPDSQRQGESQGKKRQGEAQGKKSEGTLVVRRSQARGRMASQPHTNHHARAKADRQTDRTGSNPHTDQTPQRESPPPKDTPWCPRYYPYRPTHQGGAFGCGLPPHTALSSSSSRVRVRPLCPPKRPHGPGKHQPGLQCAQT